MRDYSHGKARRETIKDYGSFRLRVNGALLRMTGDKGVEEFAFTEKEIRDVMQFDSSTAAELLLRGTDYLSDKLFLRS